MSKINQPKETVDEEVERLFKEHPPLSGEICTNPVTGSDYLGGDDPIEPQKRDARAALLAREHFALDAPPDALPLPLSQGDREDYKRMGGLHIIVGLYARSLAGLGYDLERHPSFYDYACGVMESEHNGYPGLKEDEALRKRFPPRHLPGLGPGLYWLPPARHAEVMASYARSLAREAAHRAQSR
jgi:hypothetical protein